MNWLLLLTALISGCATTDLGDFHAEGAKASAGCLKGGYALAGGQLTRAKVNQQFKGTLKITPECEITIESETSDGSGQTNRVP